jgi:transposase-like protein
MSRYRVLLKVFLIVLSLIGVYGSASTALAQENVPAETTILTLDPIPAQPVGTRITVTARLVNTSGRGLPNKVLILYVDGEQARRIRTDDSGVADIRISQDLALGDHTVEAEFIGTAVYLPARSSMRLTVRPIQLTVETVPHTANVSFSLEGQTFVSGADGFARIEINQPGTYDLKVNEVSDVQVDPDTRITFSRWADSVFQPDRTVDVSGDVHLQAGFSTSHPIGLSFVDLSGNPVDSARVASVTLKRSDGSYRTYENGQFQWLTATHIVRRREGLEAAPLLYSVESVMIDGTSAVNRYQQRFYVEKKDTWPVQLLLYSARIHATDAIFGFQIGRGIMLQYPDGHTEELQFGANKDVYVTSLARGLYHVQVIGVTGMAPLTPIALSKDQEVELKVLSGLDIGAGIGLGLTMALLLLFYKRPYLLTWLFGWIPRPRRPDLVQPDTAYTLSNDAAKAPLFSLTVRPDALPLARSVADAAVFPVNSSAVLLERLRTTGAPHCPYCGDTDTRDTRKKARNGLTVYECCVCRSRYTIYTEMLLTGSRLTAAQCELLLRRTVLDHTQQIEGAEGSNKSMRRWYGLYAHDELGEAKSLAGYKQVLLNGESE